MRRIILISTYLLSITGCGSYDLVKPNLIDNSFTSHTINEITIMPLMDARGLDTKIDRTSGNPIVISTNAIRSDKIQSQYIKEKIPYSISTYLISERGYDVNYSKDYGRIALKPGQLINLSTDTIKQLNPDDARYTMLIVLLDADSGLFANIIPVLGGVGFGTGGKAVMVAYLFDTKTGTILWRHTAEGAFFLGTVIGLFLPNDAATEEAIRNSCYKLIRAFPPKGAKVLKYNN